MINKPSDIFYCGVNKEKISNANPKINQKNLEHLYNWISERYSIHLKKDIKKESKPWTKNSVLRKYKFCNVRREHDRESRWLIENIINSKMSYENKLLNIILFRLINKSETIKIFGLIDFNNLDFNKIKINLEEFSRKNPNYVFFSNAFFTSGPKSVSNKLFPENEPIAIKIIRLVKYYQNSGIIKKIKSSNCQSEVFENLKSLEGIGNFLAYQTFVDFCYLPEFPFSENEFVVSGPGCIKGLNLIFDDFDGLNYEEALFWLRDNQNILFDNFGYCPLKLFEDLPEEDRKLNIMSLENCMCEISKYIRTINGNGRPRIRYAG